MRSTEDLSLSCDKFPFWTKVRLICNDACMCDVLKFFFNVVQVNLSLTMRPRPLLLVMHFFGSSARNCRLQSKALMAISSFTFMISAITRSARYSITSN